MPWMLRAGLAAALLNCAVLTGWAAPQTPQEDAGQWLKDEVSACSLFNADARPGDTVSWSGACADGFASGLGTASFRRDAEGARRWSGNLRVDFPGNANVFLTRSELRPKLRRGSWSISDFSFDRPFGRPLALLEAP